jgi:polysaccharide pyruvyl transferase WcaK-like protein
MVGAGVDDPTFWASIGRERNDELARWSSLLRRFESVTVRGPLSAEMLLDRCDIRAEVVGDPALILGRDMAQSSMPGRTIGVNLGFPPSGAFWGQDAAKVSNSLATALSGLRAQGWRVRYFPTCRDDVQALRSLGQAIGDPERDLPRRPYRKASRFLIDVEQCQMFIGLKLHSVVLAAARGVPSLILEYRPKCRDFQASIGQAEYVLRTDEVTASKVHDALHELRKNRQAVSADLRRQVEHLRGKITYAASIASSSLRSL